MKLEQVVIDRVGLNYNSFGTMELLRIEIIVLLELIYVYIG